MRIGKDAKEVAATKICIETMMMMASKTLVTIRTMIMKMKYRLISKMQLQQLRKSTQVTGNSTNKDISTDKRMI